MRDSNTPPSGGAFPLCFVTLKDFEGWQRNARRLNGRVEPRAYCEDCNRSYQWQMLLTNRCENPAANPE